MNELRERVLKAVAALVVKQTFIGVLAKSTWILYDPFSPLPAYTDGLKIYLGPTAANMDAKALSEVIAHEVLHIALKHPLRGHAVAARTGLPQPLLNVIADAIVNGYLDEAGLLNTLKSAAVTPQLIEAVFGVEVEGKSFEEIAEEVAKKLRGACPALDARPTLGEDIYAAPKGGSCCSGSGSEERAETCRCEKGAAGAKAQRRGEMQQARDGKAGSQKEGAEGKEMRDGKMRGDKESSKMQQAGDGEHSLSRDGGEKGSAAEKEREGVQVLNEGDERGEFSDEEKERVIERKVLSAATAVKTAGTAPAWLERFVREILRARVDWRRVLREKLRLFFGADYRPSWMRLNKKLPGLYPGKVYYERGDVIVLLDTSGSISEKELQQFVSEVFAIAKEVKRKVIVIPWDATAYEAIEVRGTEDVKKVRLRGGGGTVIAPALRAAERYMKPTTRVVIFSDWEVFDLKDGFVQEWLKRRRHQIIAVTTNRAPPPFLRSVKIDL